MEFVMDNELKLAKVWCSHADQRGQSKAAKAKRIYCRVQKEENLRLCL